MKKIFLAVLILAVQSAGADAESLVWKARKGSDVVYIGGTIHVLRGSDYPLPAAYDEAFGKAEILVLETDMNALESPEVQAKLLAEATNPEGKGLDQVLSKDAYRALEKYCEESGLPIEAINRLRPSMAVVSLLALELLKLGVSPEYGVDKHYCDRAGGEGKEMAFLETVDEQIEYILNMGEGFEDELVLNTVSEADKLPGQIDDMIMFWKAGDDDQLAGLVVAEMKDRYPGLYEKLITDRNERWLAGIEGMFMTPQVEFVLVGSAHLVGDDGIVSVLRERGYKLERVR